MITRPLYLDHCSTTPLDPAVADAMRDVAVSTVGNPSSPHQFGQNARRLLEAARERVARQLGADIEAVAGDRLVFTSGGTESNNLALLGLCSENTGRILVSAVEHPSVRAAAERLQQRGLTCVPLPVDKTGLLRLDVLESELTRGARLVSVQFGNHETGVIQPLAEISALCAAREVPLHCDAVQAVGKLPLHFPCLGVQALSFAAHKFHGPVGIGGLLLRSGITPQPILWGGTQQLGMRPGTESVMLAVGCATALDAISQRIPAAADQLSECRDHLEGLLRNEVPDLVIAGADAPRLPHVTNIAFPGCDRQSLLLALDRVGVACSSGPACQSGASEPSPVLRAMGQPREVIDAALRFSVGLGTSLADTAEAAQRILMVFKDLRSRSAARNYAKPPRFSRPHRL